ncbi:hypothetical protein FQN55_008364 [Onygenales sp. PD_40]|nr:hypothetical protein FQN55_008364 [Onygenales sp. PD_40]
MDITDFIVTHREEALLAGDYNSYRAQLSRRLHSIRKKLGQTTPRGKKFTAKPPVTAENVAKDSNFAFLILICAERAWATAMHMKSVHSSDPTTKGIIGSARRHIISRLHKATAHAQQLVQVLEDRAVSQASTVDLLEARGYLASLLGAFWMEKQRWDMCLQQYSLAKIIYGVLGTKAKRETFRDLLSSTIEPGLRYAAYQLKLPRTTPLESIAIKHFPSDNGVRGEVTSVDPDCLTEGKAETKHNADGIAQNLPEDIAWRSRTVKLEDASISEALAAASVAESQLSSWLSGPGQSSSASEKATNYDNVIIASQDAVDATKTAIDELSSEGIDQGDKRMQALQVTRTAVNYALVSWRVGRNRILCGANDGISAGSEPTKTSKRPRAGQKSRENVGRQLAQLRERTVLYDATLQSVDFIRELPGVAGDASFMEELSATRSYFQALRCLAVGRSHAILSNSKNALALFSHALALASKSLASNRSGNQTAGPPRLDVSTAQAETLCSHLQGLVSQYRGIVEIEMVQESNAGNDSAFLPPLIERLDEYPSGEVDLTRLVTYPPKMEPIPVKPLFLDVAWNYIDYPRAGNQGAAGGRAAAAAAGQGEAAGEPKKEGRKGWFGFGR